MEPGSETGTTETDDGPAGGESSSTSGVVEECVLPEGEELSGSMTMITIRNDAAEPRYVIATGDWGNGIFEVVVDGSVVNHDHDDAFFTACDQCLNSCGNGSAPGLIINSGATTAIPWNGGVWAPSERSEACTAEFCDEDPAGGSPESCSVLRSFDDGADYTVRIQVYDACPQGDEDQCTCEDGVCPYSTDTFGGGATLEASTTFPEGATIVIE